MRKQKGITLVALVVTIVILLILAAVSINITFGENGLFKRANDSADKTKNAIDYETNTLPQLMDNYIKDNIGQKEDTEEIYLVDKVEVGDYVAYDAGNWIETVASPTTHGQFGGYTSGTNKGTSVNTYNNDCKAPTNGWRVMSKSGSGASGTVTLISAGCPAQAYYGISEAQRTEMIMLLNNFAKNNFVNAAYASTAHNAQRDETSALGSETGGLRNINSYYWIATPGMVDNDGPRFFLDYVKNSGVMSGSYDWAIGVRPIVTLKSGVKTNTTKDTEFLGQTCWALK